MNIKEIELSKLVPYENNPRKNDEAVEYVANSIQEFGFKVPIVIDKNNVIVCGHTRYKACLQLGIKKVPCVIADDLTEEQVKAFRLADNKVSEKAEWDFSALNLELEDIDFIDMEDFGFEFMTEFEHEANKFQELQTDKKQNIDLMEKGDKVEGYYDMPLLEPEDFIPTRLIGFNYALSSEDKNAGIHFYLDDYQFERLWNQPEKYVDVLKEYECILTPHFSVYDNYPTALKIYNTWRGRFLGQYYQKKGIIVIPIIYWSDEKSLEYCFDGIPENGTISIYTVNRSKGFDELDHKAIDTLIETKKPKRILLYGNVAEDTSGYDFTSKGVEVIYYRNEVTERMINGKGE